MIGKYTIRADDVTNPDGAKAQLQFEILTVEDAQVTVWWAFQALQEFIAEQEVAA